MSIVIELWQRGRCPTPDAIYFADDSAFRLNAFTVEESQFTVIDSCEGGELYIEEPLAEDDRYQVVGGETSWEGCGFLALLRKPTRELVWLIHSSLSEPFRKAECRSGTIVATSREYPMECVWTIPMDTPKQLSVVRKAV